VREWSERVETIDPAVLARIDIAIDRIIGAVSDLDQWVGSADVGGAQVAEDAS
jgi:hypothetical protein